MAVPWISGNRYEFHQQNVDGSPNADGVYGLVRGETKIYVGGGNIRNGLPSHYRADNPCIKLEKPIPFVTSRLARGSPHSCPWNIGRSD